MGHAARLCILPTTKIPQHKVANMEPYSAFIDKKHISKVAVSYSFEFEKCLSFVTLIIVHVLVTRLTALPLGRY